MKTAVFSNKKTAWVILAVFFAVAETIVFLTAQQWLYRLLGTEAVLLISFLLGTMLHYGIKNTWQAVKAHPWITVIWIACGIFMFVMVESGVSKHDSTTIYGKYIWLLQAVMTPAVIFGLLGIYVWKLDTWKLYLLIGTFIGLGMMLVIPLGAVPDEIDHISTSYRLSNVLLGIKDSGSSILMRADDAALASTDFARKAYYEVSSMEKYMGKILTPLEDSSLTAVEIRYLTLNPLQTAAYLLSAFGITIGRLVGLGTYPTLLLGRLMNFIFFMAMTSYAVKVIPVGKMSLFVILLMPMTIQQGMSFSYDVFVNAFSILAIAYAVKILFADDNKWLNKKHWTILIIITVFLLPMKSFAYILIAGLPWFILLYKRHPLKDETLHRIGKMILCLAVLIAIAVVIWGLTGASSYPVQVNSLTMNNTTDAPMDGYSISYFIGHPFDIFPVLGKTFSIAWSFYLVSFVGEQLGWLDLPIPRVVTLTFYALLVFASFKRMGTKEVITPRMKLLFGTAAFITLAFIFAGMLFSWSPISMGYIQGVQGRYFTPVALLLLLLIPSDRLLIDKSADTNISLITLMTIYFAVEMILIRL